MLLKWIENIVLTQVVKVLQLVDTTIQQIETLVNTALMTVLRLTIQVEQLITPAVEANEEAYGNRHGDVDEEEIEAQGDDEEGNEVERGEECVEMDLEPSQAPAMVYTVQFPSLPEQSPGKRVIIYNLIIDELKRRNIKKR